MPILIQPLTLLTRARNDRSPGNNRVAHENQRLQLKRYHTHSSSFDLTPSPSPSTVLFEAPLQNPIMHDVIYDSGYSLAGTIIFLRDVTDGSDYSLATTQPSALVSGPPVSPIHDSTYCNESINFSYYANELTSSFPSEPSYQQVYRILILTKSFTYHHSRAQKDRSSGYNRVAHSNQPTFHLLITTYISYMLHVATNGVTHGVSSKERCDNISILFAATFARVYSCILRNRICTNGNLLQQPISERNIATHSPLSLPVMLEYSLGHNDDVLLGPTATNDLQSTPSAPHGTDAVTPSGTETNLPPPLVIPTTTGRKLSAIDRSALRDMPTNTSIEVVQLNPKQQGPASRARYENFKHSTTIAEYIDTSNGFADFFHDYTKGYKSVSYTHLTLPTNREV